MPPSVAMEDPVRITAPQAVVSPTRAIGRLSAVLIPPEAIMFGPQIGQACLSVSRATGNMTYLLKWLREA